MFSFPATCSAGLPEHKKRNEENLQKAQQDGEKTYMEQEIVSLSVQSEKARKKKQIPKA